MSTSSVFTQKYRHESKKPLGMDEKDYNGWHKWRACLVTEGHTQTGTLSVMEECHHLWLLWVFCLPWVASLSSNQASEYDEAVASFILLKADSVSRLPIIHCYEHIPLSFFPSHRSFFPGELSLLCLLLIQLKSCLFWQNANIKVFYWKW